jgi:hypothetical protein
VVRVWFVILAGGSFSQGSPREAKEMEAPPFSCYPLARPGFLDAWVSLAGRAWLSSRESDFVQVNGSHAFQLLTLEPGAKSFDAEQ